MARSKLEILLDLKKLVSAKRKLKGGQSFSKFCHLYLRKNLMTHEPAEFHKEMYALLQKTSTQTPDPTGYIYRLLIAAPRGFAKSTVCSVMFPLWLALYGKAHDIILISATISLSKELLRKIRNELETNPKILEDFGDSKSDKWTEDLLMLNNRVILRAKGRGFQIRGFRPDVIVCDDLEDEEIIYSKDQREKLEHWFFRTLLPSLKPSQSLIYVGTKLHQFSLINKLQEKEEFTYRGYKALQDGKSIWENLWTTERLLSLKKEIGSYAFEAEYQNNPISLTDQPIKPYMLENVSVVGDKEFTCLAIDPAISEKTSADYRAFVIFCRHEDGFKEVFSERGRWGIDEQVDRIIDLYDKYRPDRVIIEDIAFQKIYKPLILRKSREKKLYIPISEAVMSTNIHKTGDKRPKDKYTRLLSVSHLFEQKLVHIVNPDLVDEVLTFPHGDHDDMVDAMVHALYWLMNFRSGASMVKKEEVKIINTKESFIVDEVRPGVYMAKIGDTFPLPKPRGFINIDRR